MGQSTPGEFFYIQIFSLFLFLHFFTFLHFLHFQIFSLFYIFTFLQFSDFFTFLHFYNFSEVTLVVVFFMWGDAKKNFKGGSIAVGYCVSSPQLTQYRGTLSKLDGSCGLLKILNSVATFSRFTWIFANPFSSDCILDSLSLVEHDGADLFCWNLFSHG